MSDPPAKKVRAIFQPMNRSLMTPVGTPLLEALRASGIAIESICGGKGICKKCRVVLTKGKCATAVQTGGKRLSPEEEARGYYLACQVRLTDDCEFTIPVESRIDSPKILLASTIKIDAIAPAIQRYPVEVTPSAGPSCNLQSIRLAGYTGVRPYVPEGTLKQICASDEPLTATLSWARSPPEVIDVVATARAAPLYGVAVDLGTTTVVGSLVDLQTGQVVDTRSTLNKQITYGEELITRIGYASTPEKLAEIHAAAIESVDAVVTALARFAGIPKAAIVDMCLAGNTVMHHLFLGMEPRYLEMVNANVPRTATVSRAAELGLGLHERACVYCLPNVSRFVGGDAIGDVLASGMYASGEVSLLVDLGTNGEIILGNKDWMVSVSCASGPAFEGSGTTAGLRAMKGAIEHVASGPGSDVSYSVIGDVPPRGICGSGIIDAAAVMVETGALDFAGKLRGDHARVRPGDEGLEYVLVPADRSATGGDLVITQHDVDYLMDSKAAALGAVGVLLNKCKLTIGDVRHLYLAGAFGTYANIANATRLGILPEFPHATVHPIGNGALSGAYAALVSRRHRTLAGDIAGKMAYIDLMVDTDFFEEYLAALYIPGKRDMFPAYFSRKGAIP